MLSEHVTLIQIKHCLHYLVSVSQSNLTSCDRESRSHTCCQGVPAIYDIYILSRKNKTKTTTKNLSFCITRYTGLRCLVVSIQSKN